YDVSIVNKSRPEEPLKFFPTLESAQDAIINSSDDDGFRLGELVGTDGHGHYKIYGYNEGPKGADSIKLSHVLTEQLPVEEDITSIVISGLPAGFAMRYGNQELAADQDGTVDISDWGVDSLNSLKVIPDAEFTGAFNLDVLLGIETTFGGEEYSYTRSESITVRIDDVIYGTAGN